MSDNADDNKSEAELLADSLEKVEVSNVIGLLMTMREIQQQKPLDDPNVLMVDEDGTRYY
jgi:hypothetical protein